MTELANCPFCGTPLFIRGGVNPYGRCETEECWMASRKLGVPFEDPRQVAAWNTRAPNAAAEGLAKALEAAAAWFDDYAKEHYRKAKNAPSAGEQHGSEVKGKTNADRAAELRLALAAYRAGAA